MKPLCSKNTQENNHGIGFRMAAENKIIII